MVNTTTTDSLGNYAFTGLDAGVYMLIQVEPTDELGNFLYEDGFDYVGTLEGSSEPNGWQVMEDESDTIMGIQLGADQRAVNYVFTESAI